MSQPLQTPATPTPTPTTATTAATTTAATTTPTTYPYATYPYQPGAPGAYAYAAAGYPAGVTSYWPYYNYAQYPSQQHTRAQTAPAAATPAASSTSTASGPIRIVNTTNTSYQSQSRETAAPARGARKSNTRGLFTKELRNLMYGFGDDPNPSNDTVNVLEEILIEYLVDVCQVAAGPSRKARLSIEDLRNALSHPADGSKLARMEELLFMQEDIKRARAQFPDKETKLV